MQSWHNLWIPGGQKWQGMMTIPREISLKNGCLIQKPVREIEKYHANMVRYSDEVVSGRRSLEGIIQQIYRESGKGKRILYSIYI